MKKQILLSLATAVLSLAIAQAEPQIDVTGNAEVKVAPDEITISTGVETRDAQLNVATRQNDERIASALAFLKKSGVPDKDVQTDFIQVQPDYGPGNDAVEPRFYIARKSIEVKLTSITNLEAIVTGLLNNGVNNIQNVEFKTTQLRKYRDQARAMAITAAKEKADALCKELDVKRGKPLSINASENTGYWGGWYGNRWNWRYNQMMNGSQNAVQDTGGGSDSAGETMSIGQISVSATVNVSFAIQ